MILEPYRSCGLNVELPFACQMGSKRMYDKHPTEAAKRVSQRGFRLILLLGDKVLS